MKKIYALILSACALLVVSCGNKIDNAIDDYEDVINESVSLTKRAANGENVSAEEMAELASKAQKIQAELRDLENEMTDEQKQRVGEIAIKASQGY